MAKKSKSSSNLAKLLSRNADSFSGAFLVLGDFDAELVDELSSQAPVYLYTSYAHVFEEYAEGAVERTSDKLDDNYSWVQASFGQGAIRLGYNALAAWHDYPQALRQQQVPYVAWSGMYAKELPDLDRDDIPPAALGFAYNSVDYDNFIDHMRSQNLDLAGLYYLYQEESLANNIQPPKAKLQEVDKYHFVGSSTYTLTLANDIGTPGVYAEAFGEGINRPLFPVRGFGRQLVDASYGDLVGFVKWILQREPELNLVFCWPKSKPEAADLLAQAIQAASVPEFYQDNAESQATNFTHFHRYFKAEIDYHVAACKQFLAQPERTEFSSGEDEDFYRAEVWAARNFVDDWENAPDSVIEEADLASLVLDNKQPVKLFVAGDNDSGVKAINDFVPYVQQLDNASRARLYYVGKVLTQEVLNKTRPEHLAYSSEDGSSPEINVLNLPGVFSKDDLDVGTEVLLSTYDDPEAPWNKVLPTYVHNYLRTNKKVPTLNVLDYATGAGVILQYLTQVFSTWFKDLDATKYEGLDLTGAQHKQPVNFSWVGIDTQLQALLSAAYNLYQTHPLDEVEEAGVEPAEESAKKTAEKLTAEAAEKPAKHPTEEPAEQTTINTWLHYAQTLELHLASSLSNAVTQGLEKRLYHEIVSNPPFHNGRTQDFSITERFIADAYDALHPSGSLRLVANSGCPYKPMLEAKFKHVQEIARKNGFVVYWAQK